MALRVMVSSVRRGLADARDAVRPVITILKYEPVRFEDFTAQPIPPRASCVDAVTSSDIYLLLLGQYYGDRMPDTGLAPTAEEWTVARSLGKPIVVLKQSGVEPEPEQAEFIADVESYSTGVYRDTFSSTADLLEKLPAALRAAELFLQPLRPRRLDSPPVVPWREDDRRGTGSGVVLETYLLPVGPVKQLRAGDLEDVSRHVARMARDTGLFEERDPLDIDHAESHVEVRLDLRSTHEDRGIRVRTDRSTVVWRVLPTEIGGTIYDDAQLTGLIAGDIRTAVQSGGPTTDEVAVAIAISRIDMLARRTGTNSLEFPFFGTGSDPLHIEPDEAIPLNAVLRSAPEIARELVTRISLRLRR